MNHPRENNQPAKAAGGETCATSSAAGPATRKPGGAGEGGPPAQAMVAEWDALVERHPLATIYHTSAWMGALQATFPHMRGHLLAWRASPEGPAAGGVPIYNVSSWLLGSRLVSIPLGTLCDPLLDEKDTAAQMKAQLEKLANDFSARGITLKSRKRWPQLEEAGFQLTRRHWHHYLPLEGKLETIKQGFSRTNVRQWIQRAEKAKFSVERRTGKAAVETFYPLFVATRLRLGLPWPPRLFFETLEEALGPERLSIFIVKEQEAPVAAVLTLHYKELFILEALGLRDGQHRQGGVQLAYWTAIQWAFERRYRCVSFGQTDWENEGLASHKRAWGCAQEELCEYHYTVGGQKPSFAPGKGAKAWIRPVFQRLPVSVGTLCSRFMYRHWG